MAGVSFSRRALGLALVPVLLLGLAACQPARKDPATVERIIIVGDSLAHGAYATPGIKTYLGEYFPNAEIVALGGPSSSPMVGYDPNTGWSEWAGQVNHWLSYGFDADLVIIQGCCNHYTTSAAWRGALDGLISTARTYDPGGDRRVVLVTSPRIVPGTSPFFEAYNVDDMIIYTNGVIRDTPGVAIADIDLAWSVNWAPVTDVPGVGVVRYVDGLHFTEAGARSAAQIVSGA